MKTTRSIWGAVDDKEVLEGVTFNGKPNAVEFDISFDTDDGTFPTVASYTRLVKKMDEEGVSAVLNTFTRKRNKKVIDLGTYMITRTADHEDEAIIEFKEPIKILAATIGDVPVIVEVKKIEGRFDYDFFFTKNGRQDKYANGFEVYFIITKYLA